MAVVYLTSEPYPFKNECRKCGDIQMLDPRETFEKYERRSPHPPPIVSERREYIACEYRREQPQNERLACELRAAPQYRPDSAQLACELRARPTTTVTTYLPDNTNAKKKFPIGLVSGIAVCTIITIVIFFFAAVWLQELGIL